MINAFIEKAKEGRAHWAWFLLTVPLIWVFFAVGQGPLTLAIFIAAGFDPGKLMEIATSISSPDIPYMNEKVFFVLLMFQFLLGIFGVWVCVRFIHQRKFLSVITSFVKPRWGRGIQAYIVTMLLAGVVAIAYNLLNPGEIKSVDKLSDFFTFLPLIIIFIPFQCAFEEIAVRGFMLQWLGKIFGGSYWLAALITSMFFASLHLFNPEMSGNNPWLMFGFYTLFGFILAIIALTDEGLEIPIGIHAANNMFSFIFLSYNGSAIYTPSLFRSEGLSLSLELFSMLLLFTVIAIVFLRRKRRTFVGIFATVPLR